MLSFKMALKEERLSQFLFGIMKNSKFSGLTVTRNTQQICFWPWLFQARGSLMILVIGWVVNFYKTVEILRGWLIYVYAWQVILYSILLTIGSQCRDCSTGVMSCFFFLFLVSIVYTLAGHSILATSWGAFRGAAC